MLKIAKCIYDVENAHSDAMTYVYDATTVRGARTNRWVDASGRSVKDGFLTVEDTYYAVVRTAGFSNILHSLCVDVINNAIEANKKKKKRGRRTKNRN